VGYLNIERQKFRKRGESERIEKDKPDVWYAWAVLLYEPLLDPGCYIGLFKYSLI